MKNQKYKVILFYKFVNLKNPEKVRDAQRKLCENLSLKGRMLLAHEGVNATFEGTVSNINKYKKFGARIVQNIGIKTIPKEESNKKDRKSVV